MKETDFEGRTELVDFDFENFELQIAFLLYKWRYD